jgi:hypothetical protein
MGLKGYRTYRDNYIDEGSENLEIMQATFTPDFFSRNTKQVWDASNFENISMTKWKGTTLKERSLHEIYIVNNSNSKVSISITNDYFLADDLTVDGNGLPNIEIGPNGTAYYYCTAILENNNLIFEMRTGSQDDRKL